MSGSNTDFDDKLAQKKRELEEIEKKLELAKAEALIEAQRQELAKIQAQLSGSAQPLPGIINTTAPAPQVRICVRM